MASQKDTLVWGNRRLDILQSLVKWILKNHLKTKKKFRIFYRKGIKVLLKITSGNIKKEELKTKELIKGDGQAI